MHQFTVVPDPRMSPYAPLLTRQGLWDAVRHHLSFGFFRRTPYARLAEFDTVYTNPTNVSAVATELLAAGYRVRVARFAPKLEVVE
jgi:hypothetical protein